MKLEFEFAGLQINGARDYQEDAFLITHLTDSDGRPGAFVIVADGMGGHNAGNLASNMATQAFNRHVSANYPAINPAAVLKEAVTKANESIKETIAETPALQGMGCTLVAAILEQDQIIWASVGDSHLYLIRDNELKKVNADHSYGGFLDRMEAAGSPIDPEPTLSRNMLMSAITGEEINEIDVSEAPFNLVAGDRVLICSDGLDTLSFDDIIQFSDWSKSPKDFVNALMQAVEKADMPRQDNTTAIAINVKASSLAEAAPAQDITAVPDSPLKPRGKGKSGSFIGIAAALIVFIGAAIFFMRPEAPFAPAGITEVDPDTLTTLSDEDETGSPDPAPAETVSAEPVPPVAPPAKIATRPSGEIIEDNLESGGAGPRMVVIPAGTFQMGSSRSTSPDERPRREVSVAQFAVSQYEITVAEYAPFAAASGRGQPAARGLTQNSPVRSVSWDDARAYTAWLSAETGQRYRLASEAEWEYMASTGRKTPFWWGYEPGAGRAHCFDCESGLDTGMPARIGNFEANAFGVYDTAGNVAEWVQDCWHKNYAGAPADASVREGGDCSLRVVRGGAYRSPAQSIRSATRDKFKADQAYEYIGIRVVREIR